MQGTFEAPGADAEAAVAAKTADFLDACQLLLRNQMEASLFEDHLRASLGAQSYVLFTLPKLTSKLLRMVLQIVTVRHPLTLYSLTVRGPGNDRICWELWVNLPDVTGAMVLQIVTVRHPLLNGVRGFDRARPRK